MEALKSNKECWYYTRLLTFTLEIGMEVLHHYFEQKILNGMEFYMFLESHKHCLFHECYPTVSCCECSTDFLDANIKIGCLNKGQFQLLYEMVNPTGKDHYIKGKNNKVTQECLCRFDAKRSNEVDCMDITLLNAIISSCFLKKKKTIYGNPRHLEIIKNTRNFLAHAPGNHVSEITFNNRWAETEQAILGIASAVGKYFAKETKRKIEEFKNNELTMEKIKVIIESNADEVKKNLQALVETQRKNTTDVKDEIIDLLKKYKDELSIDIGKLRFEVKQYERANPCSSEEETYDSQDQGPNLETASCSSSKKQVIGEEKDVKKCRLEWRLEVPDSWNVTKIKKTLVKFSELLRPWFEIEFVYVGSLIIKTLVQKNVLFNRHAMHTSVHSFLEKVVEICKINTDVPEVINVALIIQLDEIDYEGNKLISDEEENYMRLCMLMDICRKAVKECFDVKFYPKRLKQTIRRAKKTLQRLKRRNILSETQSKILQGDDVDSSDFDISLMICLLRNLAHLSISDLLPRESQTKQTDQLARIKFHRNAIAHGNRSNLSDKRFLEIWDTICKAIRGLSYQLFSECERLHNTGLDLLNKDILLRIQNGFKELEFKKWHEKPGIELEIQQEKKTNPIPPNLRIKRSWREDNQINFIANKRRRLAV